MNVKEFYTDKKVFVTGHTGFKGSWLLQMLHHFGAKVKGYALAPEHECDLFNEMNGNKLCHDSVLADVRNKDRLSKEISDFQPDIIFHLAAQSLVRKSYQYPVATFDINVMGTVHVLEAMRQLPGTCVGIMITTDKVYENNENDHAFSESDKLGGHDPYSSSKAASEIVIAAYRKSYFLIDDTAKNVIAFRAGNVIGGGDYADNRIIPDIVRAINKNEKVGLRNPKSVRPWQLVIEPLSAYLLAGQKLTENPDSSYLPAYNIGPDKEDFLTVEQVTQEFINAFGKGAYKMAKLENQPHEARRLLLDNFAIRQDLGWQPKYNAAEAIRLTASWYADKTHKAGDKMVRQIESYYNTLP